jgi:hypothetical protein
MPIQSMVEMAFKGSELEGLSGDQLMDMFTSGEFERVTVHADNAACNAEFRRSFADRLRAVVPRRTRDRFYTRLSRSGERRWSFFRFTDRDRATRPQLGFERPAIARLLADKRQPVVRALDAFWIETGPKLGTPNLMCPAAYQQMLLHRDAELQTMRKRKSYSYYLQLAAKRREGL